MIQWYNGCHTHATSQPELLVLIPQPPHALVEGMFYIYIYMQRLAKPRTGSRGKSVAVSGTALWPPHALAVLSSFPVTLVAELAPQPLRCSVRLQTLRTQQVRSPTECSWTTRSSTFPPTSVEALPSRTSRRHRCGCASMAASHWAVCSEQRPQAPAPRFARHQGPPRMVSGCTCVAPPDLHLHTRSSVPIGAPFSDVYRPSPLPVEELGMDSCPPPGPFINFCQAAPVAVAMAGLLSVTGRFLLNVGLPYRGVEHALLPVGDCGLCMQSCFGYTEKAPNAWHRQGTQKTGNTYKQPN